MNPRDRIRSSETMTQPTGGLGRHAGRAFRLSANAAAMNRAFASEEKRITPAPRLDDASSDGRTTGADRTAVQPRQGLHHAC